MKNSNRIGLIVKTAKPAQSFRRKRSFLIISLVLVLIILSGLEGYQLGGVQKLESAQVAVGSGLFGLANAKVGQVEGGWKIVSIDGDGAAYFEPVTKPALITGLFYSSQESPACLLQAQLGLESGSLPSTFPLSTFCLEGMGQSDDVTKLAGNKSYHWATVELSSLTYTKDHGVLAKIAAVKSVVDLPANTGE